MCPPAKRQTTFDRLSELGYPGPHQFVEVREQAICGICGRKQPAVIEMIAANDRPFALGAECAQGEDCWLTAGHVAALTRAMEQYEDRHGKLHGRK